MPSPLGGAECTVDDCTDYGEPRYDRHGIYSGRACDRHARELPGQGDMWDYQATEDIEPEPEPTIIEEWPDAR